MTYHINPKSSGFRVLIPAEVDAVAGGSRLYYARIDQAWRHRSSKNDDGFSATLGDPADTIFVSYAQGADELGFDEGGGSSGGYSEDPASYNEIVVTIDATDRFVGNYQDEIGVWAVYLDSQTKLTVDILVSLEAGNAGWDYVTVNAPNTTDGDGSFYGGLTLTPGMGAGFGLSEGGNTGIWTVGLGATVEAGYSASDAVAAENADNSGYQYQTVPAKFLQFLPSWAPMIGGIKFDFDPFTIGIQLNTGIQLSIDEKKSNDGPPSPYADAPHEP
jgi:hypothetical protein